MQFDFYMCTFSNINMTCFQTTDQLEIILTLPLHSFEVIDDNSGNYTNAFDDEEKSGTNRCSLYSYKRMYETVSFRNNQWLPSVNKRYRLSEQKTPQARRRKYLELDFSRAPKNCSYFTIKTKPIDDSKISSNVFSTFCQASTFFILYYNKVDALVVQLMNQCLYVYKTHLHVICSKSEISN